MPEYVVSLFPYWAIATTLFIVEARWLTMTSPYNDEHPYI